MAEYTLQEIAEAVHGKQVGTGTGNIREILTDSRRVVYPAGALFVALKGTHHDGHRFIPMLYRQQVRYFLVSRLPEQPADYPEACFIEVGDTLKALQQLAAMHRRSFRKPLVAVTGSNGKTIVKEWLVQALAGKKYVVRSPKSYNSQVGVPLSLWLLDNTYDYGIIEAGISRPGEMKRLQQMIRPDIGVLTNIGEAHQEHFSSLEEKLQEKLTLFKDAGVLIYRKIPWVDEQIRQQFGKKEMQLFAWSDEEDADVRVISIDKKGDHTDIKATYCGKEYEITIPFTDEASIENAIHVWTVLFYLQCEPEYIAQAMPGLQPVAMRMELRKGVRGCMLINDYYNSDLQSLRIALDFLKQQNSKLKKTVILSDILQSGKPKAALYRDVAGLIKAGGVGKFIGVGPDISAFAGWFPEGSVFYPGTEALLEFLPSMEFRDEVILLKGARKFAFERISVLLEEQVHQTVLEVNLDALTHNLNVYRSLLRPGTRLMAMVKAFAYGSGAYEIARALEFQQVDYLAVAYADEGVMLRHAGIRLPIMVMNPEMSAFDKMMHYSLEPELYNREIMEAFIQKLASAGLQDYPVHLKIDTGMHRLGFLPEEAGALIDRITKTETLYVRSVFSHLAASEAPEQDAFTRQQIKTFREVAGRIQEALGYRVLWHILNTTGIERFPEAQFDMVRPGLGMYGISETLKGRLRTVSRFRSVVTQVKRVKTGDTVGYGRSEKARQEMTIAIIPVGYADGLMRSLSDRKGKLFVKDTLVPVIGKVCMDMCMADVTGLGIKAGDPVEIFGDHVPIEDLARCGETIPYEILAGISARVKRVYIREG